MKKTANLTKEKKIGLINVNDIMEITGYRISISYSGKICRYNKIGGKLYEL